MQTSQIHKLFRRVIVLFIIVIQSYIGLAQCIIPPLSNSILRQPNLYQLIGNFDGVLDCPNGSQDSAGGNTLNEGNWLNRGNLNLVTNGDLSLPGALYPLRLANGTGGNGGGPIQLANLPGWIMGGNSLNAYPYYAINNGSVSPWQPTDYAASISNIYLGNQKYSVCSVQPQFDHGYAVNSSLVNPKIIPEGIASGYGEATGDPISLSQTINTQIGKHYRLQFFVTGEGEIYSNSWIMGLDITGYNRLILLVPGLNKTRYEFEFKAISNLTLLSFINWGHSLTGTNTTEFILDDIIINRVPDTCSVTPINLLSFKAAKSNNGVKLIWQTSSEQNSSSFSILHSTDGLNWQYLSSITAAGNSNAVLNYNYFHAGPTTGYNYYRLKLIDINGEFKFSNVCPVAFNESNHLKLFPVPVKEILHISSDAFFFIRSLTLISLDGHELFRITDFQQYDTINMSNLPNGIYFFKIIDKDGRTEIKKITKIS